jgi:translation initiation factor 5A
LPVFDVEIGEEIKRAMDNETDILCTVLSACGEECVIATKINTAVDK